MIYFLVTLKFADNRVISPIVAEEVCWIAEYWWPALLAPPPPLNWWWLQELLAARMQLGIIAALVQQGQTELLGILEWKMAFRSVMHAQKGVRLGEWEWESLIEPSLSFHLVVEMPFEYLWCWLDLIKLIVRTQIMLERLKFRCLFTRSLDRVFFRLTFEKWHRLLPHVCSTRCNLHIPS